MRATKTLISVAAVVLVAGLGVSYLTQFLRAQAQTRAQISGAVAECVTYGSGSALQMCIHEFTDGTRCVATGGGGLASAGAGAALQCDFR